MKIRKLSSSELAFCESINYVHSSKRKQFLAEFSNVLKKDLWEGNLENVPFFMWKALEKGLIDQAHHYRTLSQYAKKFHNISAVVLFADYELRRRYEIELFLFIAIHTWDSMQQPPRS